MILNQHGESVASQKSSPEKRPDVIQFSRGKSESKFEENIINGLADLSTLIGFSSPYFSAPASKLETMYYNNRWNLISNNRALLSEMYVEHGIVQTLVDQPVDDGFRAGFEIKSSQISAKEIKRLQVFVEEERVIDAVMQAIKWARLYGGGAVIVVTNQTPSKPLNYNQLNETSPLAFIAVDLWELYFGIENPPITLMSGVDSPFYNYYGIQVDASRVFPVRGKVAPSFIRPRFRGWGMSELERVVRSLNQYLKNQDVIFELLDEAKVDIYKIKGFTQALLTVNGTQNVAKRIQHANLLKNYNNALTMDTDDEYEQKQMAFTGLAEILREIRIGIASDLKIPVTKLFGISAAGFNSGEDDIENYNSMIEGEVRSKSKYIVLQALKICCQKLFGYIPDDMELIWNPLRILSAEQEEKVKDSQHKRVLDTHGAGLCTDKEAKSSINKDSLLPIEIDEDIEAELPFEQDGDFSTKDGEVV